MRARQTIIAGPPGFASKMAARGLNMRSDLYTESGTLLGFHDGNFIYDLHGRFVGQLYGSQVYCMAGHYVGELEDGVIHDNSLVPDGVQQQDKR
jgi:hypothetical protein